MLASTLLSVIGDDIYLKKTKTDVSVSDFSLDLMSYSGKMSDLKIRSKPILKRLFNDSPVYTNIKIDTSFCLYHVRKLILSIMSISEKMRVTVHDGNNSLFKEIGHNDLISIRYMDLLESLLNRVFGKNWDILCHILYCDSYYNIFESPSPERVSGDVFVLRNKNIIDKCFIEEDYLNDKILDLESAKTFNSKNGLLFPSDDSGISKKWIKGSWKKSFDKIVAIVTEEMNAVMDFNLLYSDPSIDNNFQYITETVMRDTRW